MYNKIDKINKFMEFIFDFFYYYYVWVYEIAIICVMFFLWYCLSFVDRVHYRERARKYGILVRLYVKNNKIVTYFKSLIGLLIETLNKTLNETLNKTQNKTSIFQKYIIPYINANPKYAKYVKYFDRDRYSCFNYVNIHLIIFRPICVLFESIAGFMEGIEGLDPIMVISHNTDNDHVLNSTVDPSNNSVSKNDPDNYTNTNTACNDMSNIISSNIIENTPKEEPKDSIDTDEIYKQITTRDDHVLSPESIDVLSEALSEYAKKKEMMDIEIGKTNNYVDRKVRGYVNTNHNDNLNVSVESNETPESNEISESNETSGSNETSESNETSGSNESNEINIDHMESEETRETDIDKENKLKLQRNRLVVRLARRKYEANI